MGSAASRHKKTVNKMLAVNALTNGINENSKTEDRQTVENEDMKKSLSKSSSCTVSETEDYIAMSKRGEPRPSLTGEGRSVQESRIGVNDELWVRSLKMTKQIEYMKVNGSGGNEGVLLKSIEKLMICDGFH